MLPIYTNLNRDLEKVAQKILSNIIESYIETYKEDEEGFVYLFPETVYLSRRDKCDKAVKEITYWSNDGFRRDLSPLHEYALYRILQWAEEIEVDYKRDTNESLFFNQLTEKPSKQGENEYSDSDLGDIRNLDFYFQNCFQDYDFLSLPQFINMLDFMSMESVEQQYGIDLMSYIDLIPPDLEKKINELSEDIKQANKKKEIIEYDVFLSHSSLDKEDFVSELSNKLEEMNLKVFEDVKVFKIGHSQINMMNIGILNSRFVVVFLSQNFIKSGWSDYEFKSFLNREINEKKIIILPIWHNVSYEDVKDYNPYLVDKFALNTDKYSLDEIAASIHLVIIESKV